MSPLLESLTASIAMKSAMLRSGCVGSDISVMSNDSTASDNGKSWFEDILEAV
jgi:hypothetical protein